MATESKRGPANYNHSQLEDLKLSREQEWSKRMNKDPRSKIREGFETKLGHIYSIFLEKAYEEGLNLEADPEGYCRYLQNQNGRVDIGRDISLDTQFYLHPLVADSVLYFSAKGLSKKGITEIVFEGLGTENKFTSEEKLHDWLLLHKWLVGHVEKSIFRKVR